MQEARAITSLHQRRTGGCLALQPSLLVVAQGGLKPCSTVQERQAKRPVPLTKAEDALIVVHRGWLKRRVGFALDLQGSTDTCNSPYGQVRRQAKAAPHISVAGISVAERSFPFLNLVE